MLRGDSTRLLNCAIALVSLCSIRRQFSCLKHPRTCKGKYTAKNAEPQGTNKWHTQALQKLKPELQGVLKDETNDCPSSTST
jgi:hypothetical protein